jgi:hypothetical protein
MLDEIQFLIVFPVKLMQLELHQLCFQMTDKEILKLPILIPNSLRKVNADVESKLLQEIK